MIGKPRIQRFETSEGGVIFQIPLNAFPGFWVYAYLVLVEDYKVLIDTGSNYHESNQHLAHGFETIGEAIGEAIGFEDLTHILITHGHIDHFAGLAFVRPQSSAKVGIHEFDLRNLTNYEERLIVVSKRLSQFLLECGVSRERTDYLLDMYMMPKALFNSVGVDFTYESIGMNIGPFSISHMPGHCAGAVVIQLHDVLFTGDHILSDITPHQAPERLTLNTGLGTYIQSLRNTKPIAKNISLALGGHKAVMTNLSGRIEEILQGHRERIAEILELLDEPSTISTISKTLFGMTEGYNVLLALEETGAHIEYLYQRGYLGIHNIKDLQQADETIPIEYIRLDKEVEFEKTLP